MTAGEAEHVATWERQRSRLTQRLRAIVEAEEQSWFLWLPVLFGLGISLYFAQAQEPGLGLLVSMFAGAAALRLWAGTPVRTLVFTGVLAVAAGAVTAKVRTLSVAAPILPTASSTVALEGWIERVEPQAGGGQRYTVRVHQMTPAPSNGVPQRVRVRANVTSAALKPGDAIKFRASLGPPPPPAAPRDFDFGRLAYFSGLGGFGRVIGGIEKIDSDASPPLALKVQAVIERLRQAIRDRIMTRLPGETGEIATALITGERGGITEETNQAYRNSGLFHILSISGLHMVVMAGAVFYILRAILALFPHIALTRPIKAWAAFGAIAGAFAYLMISGASFATVRAWIMITIMFSAVIADRPALTLRNVALAALVILLIWPESLFDAGFQMSFAAVVGLVAAFDWLRQRRSARGDRRLEAGSLSRAIRFVGEIVASTVVASLVVAPFGIYHFHNTQLLSILANVLAIPICNLLVMPAALGVLVTLPLGLEAVPLLFMGYGVDAMTAVARTVGKLPGAVVKVAAIPDRAFALMVAGGLMLLLLMTRLRFTGAVLVACGIALAPTLPRPDILISRDGATVAIRGADGRLSAIAIRANQFDLARWLEQDGDARAPDVAARARAFACDGVGCIAKAGEKVVSVAHSLSALEEDCSRADIIIVRDIAPRGCAATPRSGQIIVDRASVSSYGAQAIYVGAAGIRVETVAGLRGVRPWSMTRPSADDSQVNDRTVGFTALFEQFRNP